MYNYKDTLRFWSKVDIRSEDKCWEWTKYTNNKGYGVFSIGNTLIYAHRFAYWIYSKQHPGKLKVCHSCDNPLCCNPKHLWLGTQLENMQDAKNKGRIKAPPAHYRHTRKAKLTTDEVKWIKWLCKNTNWNCSKIAKCFPSVGPNAIWEIKRGITWKWV